MISSSRKGNVANRLLHIILACAAALLAVSPASADVEPADTAIVIEASDTIMTLPATASGVFIHLPVNVLDILPRSSRLDMLAYYHSGNGGHVTNAMGGESWLLNCTDDFLEVRLTSVSTFQIKLLPRAKKEPIVMTLYTIGGDGRQPADTDVRFFEVPLLTELDRSKIFKEPRLKDYFFIPKGSVTKMKEIEEMIPFPTYEFTAAPGADTLTGRLTIGDYLNQDDYNILRLFLLPAVDYSWNGRSFRLIPPPK